MSNEDEKVEAPVVPGTTNEEKAADSSSQDQNGEDAEKKKSARARWPALESNPDAFSDFIVRLGIQPTIGLHDVFGFEPDLLMMVPQPIYAIIFLFPHSKLKKLKVSAEGGDAAPGATPAPSSGTFDTDKNIFFLHQSRALGNACGTIACIHALSNLRSTIPFEDDSLLGQYLQQAISPEGFAASGESKEDSDKLYTERGRCLEFFEPMRKEQVKSASSRQHNQTAATDGRVDYHFICFVEINGCVYEVGGSYVKLDGAKEAPLNRGKISDLGFAMDVGKVIQEQYMAQMPDEMNFATLALAPVWT